MVALFWKKSWTCESSVSLSPWILLANLRNKDGQLITVIGAHMHHKPGKREAQYELLRKATPHLLLAPHIVMLADHNSIITPGVDSKNPQRTMSSHGQQQPGSRSCGSWEK